MNRHKKSPPRTPDPRDAALALLLAVHRDGRLLAEALEAADSPLGALDGPDRARAQRLATQALRHGRRVDAALKPWLQRQPPLRVRLILHLAVTELCAEGGAAHGVVNAAVSLTRAHPKTASMAGLVNAVLRRAAEALPAEWETLPPARLPGWLRGPLVAAHGQKAAAAIDTVLARTPPLDLTPRDGDPEGLAARLGGVALPSGSVRLASAGQVSALPGYADGDWWVQDAAAALPVRVLAPRPGERVLDLCAAPGGKTLQLAAAGAAVTALDLSAARMTRVSQNLARCRLAAETVVADALLWEPAAPYDAILLDAPCSASGTIRRHPDLPWVKTGEGLADLVQLQGALLARALRWLAPGGRLVFCTCSMLPEEGEARIRAVLADTPGLAAVPLDPERFGLPRAAACPEGMRLRPDFWAEAGGMDGFFIARLESRPETAAK